MGAATATVDANQVLLDAEHCRREALAKVQKNSVLYAKLLCQPSGWCVVTERFPWSRRFHAMQDEDELRERIERGHRVVLIVGLVANPNIPLSPSNHVAVISICEPASHSPESIAIMGIRAKLYAARALYSQY